MLRFAVLQNQWLMLAIGGGLAMILLMFLFYAALWRPRPRGGQSPEVERATHAPTLRGWLTNRLPWLLIVVFSGMIAWGVLYTLMAASKPPNW